MKKAVIINGFGGCGKDTFIEILREKVDRLEFENIYHIYSFSSVDKVKEAAKILGWNGTSKTEKDRRFLHDLKNIVTEYNDGCTKYMKGMYEIHGNRYLDKNCIIFFHVREPKEIDKLKNEIEDTLVIYVKNDNVPRNDYNLEDKDIENYPYDYIVNNSGTIKDLKKEADKFINWMNQNYFKREEL